MKKYFFVRSGSKYVKINFQEILYLEGRSNYIRVVSEGCVVMVLMTMKKMETILPPFMFCRIHKSFIVSIDKIMAFDSKMVQLENKTLPVGECYKARLEKSVLIIQEEKNPEAIIAPISAAFSSQIGLAAQS
ncbi:MAG TPA: LytTR family DNA-binding domain-containing protein [Chitinophagaceae bacterium]|jgi:DNA-binding LytR/AlgR family response regulator|nr:LytTR family DNA-binding domain-containing protein [Chitinophagaceae bacterium]